MEKVLRPGDLVQWTVLKWRAKQDEPSMGMLIACEPFNDYVALGIVLRTDGKVVRQYIELNNNPL